MSTGTRTNPPTIFNLFVRNPQSDKGVNLQAGFRSFAYYESVFSPFTTARLSFIDSGFGIRVDSNDDPTERTGTVDNALKLTGSDLLVAFGHPSGTMEFDEYRPLKVIGATDNSAGEGKKIIDLRLQSEYGRANKDRKVGSAFKNNSTIKNSVYRLLTEQLGVPGSRLELEDTVNSLDFTGYGRSPLETAVYLASKSKAVDGPPAFFFWEYYYGFKFKSIDNLIQSNPVDTYTKTDVSAGDDSAHPSCRIIESRVVIKPDVERLSNVGLLKNDSIFFDFRTFDVKTESNTALGISADFSTLGSKSISAEMGDLISDVDWTNPNLSSLTHMCFLDPGNNASAPGDDADSDCGDIISDYNNNPLYYQARAAMRYNSIVNNVIDIVVPCNLALTVGQVIRCMFPKVTSDNRNEGVSDEATSGKYLILELSHQFSQETQTGALTHMRLGRDTHGLYTSDDGVYF